MRPMAEELWRSFPRIKREVPKVQGRRAESLRQKDRAFSPAVGAGMSLVRSR